MPYARHVATAAAFTFARSIYKNHITRTRFIKIRTPSHPQPSDRSDRIAPSLVRACGVCAACLRLNITRAPCVFPTVGSRVTETGWPSDPYLATGICTRGRAVGSGRSDGFFFARMGKKKKRDGAAARRQARVVVGGVRTRAAVTARRVVASAEEGCGLVGRGGGGGGGGDDGEGGCYLRLRSRRLPFVAAAVVSSRREEALGDSVAEAASSSSPRAVELLGCSGEEEAMAEKVCTQAGEDHDEESSVGDSGCGRERSATTPSSRRPPGDADSSDAESNQEAKQQMCRRSSTTSAAAFHAGATTRSFRMMAPPAAAAEIEEFLAAAERSEAERFAAKYNFDVVHGVPLDAGGAGRFEWTAVGSG
ncbi:cyclin-dependent kinase inhibitor 2 [Oryza glaberrima]|nr:cyclin-dependent kinase inhibitor 2 [Oryza glaberrima]